MSIRNGTSEEITLAALISTRNANVLLHNRRAPLALSFRHLWPKQKKTERSLMMQTNTIRTAASKNVIHRIYRTCTSFDLKIKSMRATRTYAKLNGLAATA